MLDELPVVRAWTSVAVIDNFGSRPPPIAQHREPFGVGSTLDDVCEALLRRMAERNRKPIVRIITRETHPERSARCHPRPLTATRYDEPETRMTCGNCVPAGHGLQSEFPWVFVTMDVLCRLS